MEKISKTVLWVGVGSALMWMLVVTVSVYAWIQGTQIQTNLLVLLVSAGADGIVGWVIMQCAVGIWRDLVARDQERAARDQERAARDEQHHLQTQAHLTSLNEQTRQDLIELGTRMAAMSTAMRDMTEAMDHNTSQLARNAEVVTKELPGFADKLTAAEKAMSKRLDELNTTVTDTYSKVLDDAVGLAAQVIPLPRRSG